MTRITATLAVDCATDLVKGSSQRIRQHNALKYLLSTAPADIDVRLGSTNPKAVLMRSWPRNGNPTHSTKNVPFVRDILDWATEQKAPLGGFINSDIYLHPFVYGEIRRYAAENVDCVFAHRTDVTEGQFRSYMDRENPNEGSKIGVLAARGRSCDGVFFSRDAWQLVRHYLPDFVVAEPYWDTAVISCVGALGLDHRRLSQRGVLHIKHDQAWGFNTPAGQKAAQMFEEMERELKVFRKHL